MLLLWMLIIGLLVWVAWEDFRYRAVLTVLFPILGTVILVHTIWLGTFSVFVVITNLAIVGVQLAALALTLYWRTGRWILRDRRWIGWGDIAFFAILACCFSTANFVLFFAGSLFILLFVVLAAMAFGHVVLRIPLAGGQATLLAFAFLMDHAQLGARLSRDVSFFGFF